MDHRLIGPDGTGFVGKLVFFGAAVTLLMVIGEILGGLLQ